MAYISDYGLNWLVGRLATQTITIGLHTGAPGNAGTANELSSAGARNYARKAVAASGWSASGAETDNDDTITIFTPNAASAGDSVTHVSYWLGSSFFGWAELQAPVTTIASIPFSVAAGTADFRLARPA
ncbi:phage tail fiber protein [Ruegeria sp.]|uniref:phage tail fiber protein n=1 Tax=Ruegeria sp. TaxID=1879320 RepID=UPI003B5C1AF9